MSKYKTTLTLTQEDIGQPLEFQMEWSPPLSTFAGEQDENVPATHALMQHIFIDTLLPLTDSKEPVPVAVSNTLQ